MKTGIELIAEERQRQKDVEGWTHAHDDNHGDGELALAAGAYALAQYNRDIRKPKLQFWSIVQIWPWDLKWWKPSPRNRVKELVKAGALIAAEIDRLNRKPTKNFGR